MGASAATAAGTWSSPVSNQASTAGTSSIPVTSSGETGNERTKTSP